jgi:hypothetical protein
MSWLKDLTDDTDLNAGTFGPAPVLLQRGELIIRLCRNAMVDASAEAADGPGSTAYQTAIHRADDATRALEGALDALGLRPLILEDEL